MIEIQRVVMRKFFRKKANSKGKIDTFLDKYKLPRAYFNINRKMITRGVAIGIFWAFIPMPMQMLAVVASTLFIRFNVPIAIVMVWLSNPFTMPFMYYIEYLTGNFILGNEKIEGTELSIEWFSSHLGDIFVPLYVGTAFYSIVFSSLTYFFLNWLWVRSVKDEKREKREKPDQENNKMSIKKDN